jgi:hypothetical protein
LRDPMRGLRKYRVDKNWCGLLYYRIVKDVKRKEMTRDAL